MPRWTEESRRKQAELIRKNKPWEKSTGPRTAAGKARSRMNALKHGLHGLNADALRQLLHHNKEFVRQSLIFAEVERLQHEQFMRNEVNKNRLKSKEIPSPP